MLVLSINYTPSVVPIPTWSRPGAGTAASVVPRRRHLVATACVSVLVLAGCASGDADAPATRSAPPPPDAATQPQADAAESAPPAVIMATTTIWADVIRNVACGGLADVESILPPLADPHDFEPSMSDRARLDTADLIVANGLGLEMGLDDMLASAEADGTPVFSVGDNLTTLEFDAEPVGDHSDEDEEEDGDENHGDGDENHGDGDENHGDADHGHGSVDPHVWMDPLRVAQVVESLDSALVTRVGLDADRVAACTDTYLAELSELHHEITATLERVPAARRKLVTNHDSLGYFADRYRFEVVGTVIPAATTLAEPSPAGLEALAALIDETGVPAIFAEELGHGAGPAAALADRLDGVSVVNLYTGALGAEGSGAESYVAMMRHNAEAIAAALDG